MKIYLATNNLHKKKEMEAIFTNHEIVIPSDEGITFNPEETGKTFAENSLLKAKTLWKIVHQPVLADDSGICVDILNGVPGIYSARYAGKNMHTGMKNGEKISQAAQNKLLIEETNEAVEKVKVDMENPRSCRYVCALTLYFGPDRYYLIQETLEGNLIKDLSEQKGCGGFGYDPIVLLKGENRTIAQLTEEEKNEISHRGKAGKVLNKLIS